MKTLFTAHQIRCFSSYSKFVFHYAEEKSFVVFAIFPFTIACIPR